MGHSDMFPWAECNVDSLDPGHPRTLRVTKKSVAAAAATYCLKKTFYFYPPCTLPTLNQTIQRLLHRNRDTVLRLHQARTAILFRDKAEKVAPAALKVRARAHNVCKPRLTFEFLDDLARAHAAHRKPRADLA